MSVRNDAVKVYRKPTIRDVAEHAKVSQSAVSHYINGRVNICSKATGERIQAAIDELNFVPARSIFHQQARATKTIGVCVSPPPTDTNLYTYSQLHNFWSGVSEATDAYDYKLLHFPTSIRNGDTCDAFLDGSIDGLLISPINSDKRLSLLARTGLPTVSTARWTNLPNAIGAVWSNDACAVVLAMEHLWSLGHRRIAHIAAGTFSQWRLGESLGPAGDAATMRCEQYRQWMAERGLSEHDFVVSNEGWGELTLEQTRQAFSWLLDRDQPSSAVLCANDAIAVSLVRAAEALGVSVPGDLSIVGIDNNIAGATTNPGLTSVELPFCEIGREAFRMLHQMMVGQIDVQLRTTVPVTNLIVRHSTGPVSCIRL